MMFSEIPYSRPDTEALKAEIAAAAARLAAAASFEEADAIFREFEERNAVVNTAFTVAQIRHDIDTADEFYDGEVEFFDNVLPEIQECAQQWTLALLQSPYRREFEEKYNELLFTNAEIELKCFSPEIISELQRENSLTTEYSKLLASAQIPFEGETYTLSQLTPLMQDADDKRRAAAWRAADGWFSGQRERLDAIFDELTALRDEMGKKLGYGGYIPLGYYRMTRNCYDQKDVESFRAAVVKNIVPLAAEVYKHQAQRLGVAYPMSYANAALAFRSGNPKPQGGPEDILAQGRRFYHELSPETAEFIDVMLDNELMDVLSRKGKAGGGYCTSLPQYKVPFIFANFNGTSGDVEVITHEAGHAFAAYTARDIMPSGSRWPTMEACEVHSMSMEFFAWPWAEGFFGKDTRKFLFTHLSGSLTFIPYGTMVDHFQHIVYEHPEMTPDERAAEWRRLMGIYQPWLDPDEDTPFFASGRYWQRQMHIYQSPFYYIDYCLAQTVALQFWAEIQKSPRDAWQKYMTYTSFAGTKTFRDLVAAAGLDSPFEDTALSAIAQAASQWLEDCDLSGIV